MSRPLKYLWDGEVMRPLKYFAKLAGEQFTKGHVFDLAEVEQRNMASHRGFFATVHTAWSNLNEQDAERFPSAEHLRKWALTYTPFCTLRIYQATSRKEAERVAEFLQQDKQFSRVMIEGKEVWHYVPNSQAIAAMPNNRTFQASKQAVLIVLAQRLGVDVNALEEAGRNAA